MLTKPALLQGSSIQLEPLHESHYAGLNEASHDESIWTYSPFRTEPNRFQHWFDKALQDSKNQQHITFAIRRLHDQKIVGSTRYYDINQSHAKLVIGYTWYMPEVRGTSVNPESKYCLLKNVFENWKFNRVEFHVDARNTHSRAAVKKLGATEEGILRKHIILNDGFVRDTVMYSIIHAEWPELKIRLEKRLNALLF